MKKINVIEKIKNIFNIKQMQKEIEEQDIQYEELLCEYGKLETLIEQCQKKLDQEIELKNKYLNNCKKLRIKLKKYEGELWKN